MARRFVWLALALMATAPLTARAADLVAAAPKLAVVDMDQVADQLGVNFQYRMALSDKTAEERDKLQEQGRELARQVAELRAKLAELGDDDVKRQDLQTQIRQIEIKAAQLTAGAQQRLAGYNQAMQARFRARMQPIIEKVCRERGIDVLLQKRADSVLFVAPAFDATAVVVAEAKKDPHAFDELFNEDKAASDGDAGKPAPSTQPEQ